jgi:DNA-binding transcriptional ArsR family regulator
VIRPRARVAGARAGLGGGRGHGFALDKRIDTQHLQILADAGLVIGTRIGKWTFFKRNEVEIRKLKKRILDDV